VNRHHAGRPAPALAPPDAWAGGRPPPPVDLAVEARVRTTREGLAVPPQRTSPLWTVSELCRQPRSVAEVAAHLSVPLGVARVLVADLLDDGLVTVQGTLADDAGIEERRELIERVLSGLHTR
jgi:hypothetical protein